MELQNVIHSSPRRRASPRLAEGFSPTATGIYRNSFVILITPTATASTWLDGCGAGGYDCSTGANPITHPLNTYPGSAVQHAAITGRLVGARNHWHARVPAVQHTAGPQLSPPVERLSINQYERSHAMKNNLPAWALKTAVAEDHANAGEAHHQGRMQITWPDAGALRRWAKQHGWPTPLFGFEDAFIAKMLSTKEHFELAIEKSGIEMQIPRREYTISAERLKELDAFYEERSDSGRPNSWGILVEELREIRRAVEAGIVVKIEGEQPLLNWQRFYAWAYGRYHMLEDGYDKWIGDDS
jgi:hypothetical protein